MRKELWEKHDERVTHWKRRKLAPAMVQELEKGGTWWVLILVERYPPVFGKIYRMFKNPPEEIQWEPFYNDLKNKGGGDERFRTKEDARDFYQYQMGLLSFIEYLDKINERHKKEGRCWSNKIINLGPKGGFSKKGVYEA